MTWSEKIFRSKYKTVPLTYSEEEWDKLEQIKDIKGMTWNEFFFYAAVNVRIKKKKEVKK